MWYILWDNEQKPILWNQNLFLDAPDNQSLSESYKAKVDPLYDPLNKKNQQFGIAHKDLSIDASMVA